MLRTAVKRAALILAAALAMQATAGGAEQKAYAFYVLNQRSVALTAQYWNPILTHVGKKAACRSS